MWISRDGRLNSASLPPGHSAAQGRLQSWLEDLDAAELRDVSMRIEARLIETIGLLADLIGYSDEEDQWIGVAPPEEVVEDFVANLMSGHADVLAQINPRWQLDVLAIAQDSVIRVDLNRL